MFSRPLFATAATLCSCCLCAQDGTGNALRLLDAWLARAAVAEPEYRADLRAGGDSSATGPGRISGFSPLLGTFTYRPKTYGELSPPERLELLRDPKFRAFVIRAREEADIGLETGANQPLPREAGRAVDFSPTPREILTPGDTWLILPP